jgi:hypothetical protein
MPAMRRGRFTSIGKERTSVFPSRVTLMVEIQSFGEPFSYF